MAKPKEQTAPPKKQLAPKKPTKGEFVIKSYKQAVEILRGAGIPVNEKDKTMTWFFDRPQSKKVIKAASYLDIYQVEQKNNFKTIWMSYNEYVDRKARKINES